MRSSPAVGWEVARVLAGSWRQVPPALDLADEEIARLLPALMGGGVAGLAWRRLAGNPAAGPLRDAYRLQRLRSAVAEREIARHVARLQAAGIEPLLVKGWALVRAYADPGLRPCGDIDLCVAPGAFTRAAAVVGSSPSDGFLVDLHAGYAKSGDDFEGLLSRAERVPIGDTTVRVPAREDHLRLVCAHFLSHGGWRALWLVDIALLLESKDLRWDRVLAGRKSWILALAGLAQRLMDADVSHLPIPPPPPPAWLVNTVLRGWERATGLSQAAPVGLSLRQPRALLRELLGHWRDPVMATFETGAPVNRFPRLPLQVAAGLLRLGARTRMVLSVR